MKCSGCNGLVVRIKEMVQATTRSAVIVAKRFYVDAGDGERHKCPSVGGRSDLMVSRAIRIGKAREESDWALSRPERRRKYNAERKVAKRAVAA